MNPERRKRKARSAKERIAGAPLYVVAGLPQDKADEIEKRARALLSAGVGGEVFVPRVSYKVWYSPDEARQIFRLAAQKIVAEAETASETPTPSTVFLLFTEPVVAALRDNLLDWFQFWAWPEPLTHDAAEEGIPPAAHTHWTRNPRLAAEAIVGAARKVHATESRWRRVAARLQGKSALRLPPINFRFPDEGSHLSQVYSDLIRGGDPALPRLQRVGQGTHQILGNQHYRDECGRFFPLGKGEHGALRELEGAQRSDDRIRHVWLSAAYRFGCWIGDQHEHYDVQRGEGEVSPPEVYCARRRQSAHAAKPYVNVFINDCVRDNDVFEKQKTQG